MRKFTTFILLCCAFLMLSTHISAQNADIELLKSINSNTSAPLRGYSKFMSETTTIVGFSAPVVMTAVALLEKDDDLLKSGIYIGASLLVDEAIIYGLKTTIRRTRPYAAYPDLITNYDTGTTGSTLSFPSGHTSFAFATATALSIKYPKWYVIAPSYFWACSVGYSRMNLGVHYPSDVLAGAVIGVGSAFITYKANEWFWKKQENKKLIGLQAYL